MDQELEKYKITSHWAAYFLQEIERQLEAGLDKDAELDEPLKS